MIGTSPEEITDGSLLRALLVLAAPLIAQNLTQVVQQVVDIFWVGRLGAEAVAAVGLVFPVTAVLGVLVALTPHVATQVLVSQRVGAGDEAGARVVAVHGVAIGVFAGVVVAVAGHAAAESIVSLFGAGPTVRRLAIDYLSTWVFLLPFVGASDALEGAFTGFGDSRAALYITLVTVGVNVALDPVLVLGLGPVEAMGVRGAATATVLGYTTGLLLAITLALGPRESVSLSTADLRFDADLVSEAVAVGGPLTVQRLVQDAVRLLLVGVVSAVGGAAGLAAYTIGGRVASVATIPAGGLQQAAQSVVGQNLGAEQPARADRATWLGVAVAAVALGLVGAGQLLVPESLVRLFVPDADAGTLSLAVVYLRILAYGYWAIGASYLFQAGFNAANRTRASLVLSLVQYWGVRLPVAAVGAYLLGLDAVGVFWAVTVSNVVAAVVAGGYYHYRSGRGLHRRAVTGVGSD
jgi:putative MATE family efflux protein